MNTVNLIAAVGADGSIGRGGNLIWHIPADLRRFKSLTMGHPVIMGRKTWESLPKRPLPGRLNIVMTRCLDYEAPGAVTVHSPEEAMAAATVTESGECVSPFVMGGGEIYNLFIPFATRLYLTLIDAGCPDADARLEWNEEEWMLEEETAPETTPEGVSFRYANFARK